MVCYRPMPSDLFTATLGLANTSSRSFGRRSFLKALGTAALAAPFVTRDLIARPPSNVLRHASFGAGGMAWSDLTELTKFKQLQLVAVADVDLNRTGEVKKMFPRARIYQDWRELLDKEGKRAMRDGVIQFIEPDDRGKSHREEFEITGGEVAVLEQLIKDVAQEIRDLAFWEKGCNEKDCRYCELRKGMG